jgi:hypothetical protein
MQERYIGRLEPGMDVCDIDGEKIGSVNHVYRHAYSTVGGTGDESQVSNVATAPGEDVIEVKTGLFGLGKHYYMPFSAIHDVTSGCVFINKRHDDIDGLAWDVKPDYLDEMS